MVTGSGGGAVISSSGGGDICEEDTVSEAQSLASAGKAGEEKLVWGTRQARSKGGRGLGYEGLLCLVTRFGYFPVGEGRFHGSSHRPMYSLVTYVQT